MIIYYSTNLKGDDLPIILRYFDFNTKVLDMLKNECNCWYGLFYTGSANKKPFLEYIKHLRKNHSSLIHSL